jgi:tartrate-resistant acid phosphatase type 5
MPQSDLNRRHFLATAPLLVSASAFPASLSARLIDQPLNFVVIGDWGRKGKAFQKHVAWQMARTAAESNSRFVVTTGDNFYDLGVSSETDPKWASSFDGIYVEQSMQRHWFPTLGNHDYGGDVYAQIKRSKLSDRWCMPDRWYDIDGACFGYPDVHLFIIDTVVWRGKESFPYAWLGSGIKKGDQIAQRNWLRAKLGGSKARIKLVFGHHPIYSVGKHGGKPDILDLDLILREHRVAAYINGHDHCLYHITHNGMHYVCSGGGSEELRQFKGDKDVYGCVLPGECGAPSAPTPKWERFIDRAGFAAFSVGADYVNFRLIDRDGTVSHERTIQVA